MKHIFLYGPPGSGKSSVGKLLAQALGLPYLDLDEEIERAVGQSIPQTMAEKGEPTFRNYEAAALEAAASGEAAVISLGGGALLRDSNRACAEVNGEVILLETELPILLERLRAEPDQRPLLSGDLEEKLGALLDRRREHYKSFILRVATDAKPPEAITWEIQQILGHFHVRAGSPGYDVLIQKGGLDQIGELVADRKLGSPAALVADSNVAKVYGKTVLDSLEGAGYQAQLISIPAGEEHKTLETVSGLWQKFLEAGLDRKSTVVALGGGVTGDLAGFAASTFMRGIDWVGIPTSLLAMVDASMGGKTGFDLPYGKNLVGAFHSPRLVLTDPEVLSTLPDAEFSSGLGEVVKHGVIADPELFELCSKGLEAVKEDILRVVQRAVAVKIRIIEADPFERGIRAALNLGHTVGHAVELVSGFKIKHGEAVAIGMVSEARLAEKLSLAAPGLSEQIASVLSSVGLPTEIPADLPRELILQTMQVDKKKHTGNVRFSLPVAIGEVKTGIVIDDLHLIFPEG